MSNARSPREVCSTTIGTRGLIGPHSIEGVERARCPCTPDAPSSVRSGSPEPAGCLALLLRRPELLPRLGLLLARVGLLGIGFAASATRSIALRTRMSSRTIASRPLSRSRSSSFSGVVRSCSAVWASASTISSSATSIPSASAIAAITASRFSSLSASGFDSSISSSRVLPCICRKWSGSMPRGELAFHPLPAFGRPRRRQRGMDPISSCRCRAKPATS